MVKILHLADIHLGMENYGRLDPATGLSTRLIDFLRSFDEALDGARAQDVDLVLFCGDAYKTRDPNPTVQREFAKRVLALASEGIPVFLLAGNHDLPNMTTRAHALEIFDTLKIPNVYVARTIKNTLIQTKHGPIQIVALPWVLRSVFLTREEYRQCSIDELDNLLLQKVDNVLEDKIAELAPDIPTILACHGTIAGAIYGSEKSIMLGRDTVFQRSVIARPQIDYVAMGHIHKHQAIGEQPVAVYPGSLERIDFGEEKEAKGYVIVDIQHDTTTRQVEWKFHPTQARRFITLDITAAQSDPTTAVLRHIERRKEDLKGSIVRVRIATTLEYEAELRMDDIRAALAEAHYIAAVVKEVDRPVRRRFAGFFSEEVTPLQALEKYLTLTKPEALERNKSLISYAGDLIAPRSENLPD